MTTAPRVPNLKAKRARFLRFNGPVRLGNLASTLMRAADQASDQDSQSIIRRMLEEARLFLAWDDSPASPRSRATLAEMKSGLDVLESRWEAAGSWDAALAAGVAAKCRAYSDQALALSGLLDE